MKNETTYDSILGMPNVSLIFSVMSQSNVATSVILSVVNFRHFAKKKNKCFFLEKKSYSVQIPCFVFGGGKKIAKKPKILIKNRQRSSQLLTK
jgi:hypothetical protein